MLKKCEVCRKWASEVKDVPRKNCVQKVCKKCIREEEIIEKGGDDKIKVNRPSALLNRLAFTREDNENN